jgi:hydrogenase expression/formation protein HypE
MTEPNSFALSCPIPISEYPTVTLAHGGGGKLMNDLIEKMFVGLLADPSLNARHDGAILSVECGKELAFTTDSYVVRPIFFPGGDIGSLAVHGTVNDLAMCGARPLYLSVGFILEEGLPMETLWRVVRSMKQAADLAGVSIVTGDTKVVDRGKCDEIFINTAGVGEIDKGRRIFPSRIEDGDVVLLSGDVGRHGIAVMAVREGLKFETTIESDSAPVAGLVMDLLDEGIGIHCMRDLTRGGLVSALNEISQASGLSIHIQERSISVMEEVRGACEILGLDPLSVANEGRFVIFLPEDQAAMALQVLRSHPLGTGACAIGTVIGRSTRGVTLETTIGVSRLLLMPNGEQLPRIC